MPNMSNRNPWSGRVGRAVRDAMRPDLPGAAEERIRARKAGEQANREMMERFAPLTPENAGEAIKWQEQRIRELMSDVRLAPRTLSERDGTATDAQRAYLRKLLHEASSNLHHDRTGLDPHHLDRVSAAEASRAIDCLKAAKAAGWPRGSDHGFRPADRARTVPRRRGRPARG